MLSKFFGFGILRYARMTLTFIMKSISGSLYYLSVPSGFL